MLKSVPGTKDILPEAVSLWQKIESASRHIFSLYNYKEIRTPIIEDIGLFNRSLGETTEIVQKQMFVIQNKTENYVLRPEGTAAVVRAYLENGLDKSCGFVKFYYLGPMFRFERPQKGRLRQFHHIGAEVIGSDSPNLDVEVISLADHLLKTWGISGHKIIINSLGCLNDKKNLIAKLKNALGPKIGAFCPECQNRFKTNILRILDCKNETCQAEIKQIDFGQNGLCPECKTHFNSVREGLDNLKIEYQVNPYLVRGLDYYTRTVFEIKHADLGAQDAIGAGGRYDHLVEELSGPKLSAIGFAFGIERVILAAKNLTHGLDKQLIAYLICLGQEAEKEGIKLLDYLRKSGINCDTSYENKSLKGAMRKAQDLGAQFVLILGEDELKKKVIAVKNMSSGEQKETALDNLIKAIKC